MQENYVELNKHYEASTFPMFMLEKIKPLGINGIKAKGYGSAALSCMEGAAAAFEMAKMDASFVTGFTIHNLPILCISKLGNEE
jgi:alkylation response protein AidB-like acyl-CoA dehydrogenase